MAKQLGLYRKEELEGLERRRVLIGFRTGRGDGLNRGVVAGRFERMWRAFQPRLRVPYEPLLGTPVGQARKRLRRRRDTAMADGFLRTRVGLPDRRGICRRDKK
jgi:hypothetical protein